MISVSCDNVCISYKVGDLKSIGLKEYCMRRIKGDIKIKELLADNHVTFSLEQGDMLGIIGSNGAGKSTLLKAVSGIMIPSEGTIEANGTIAALLELTSGFDLNMTVKENTFLRGALMGYTREFMNAKYDEIIAFAELEDYQDYYFKQLSSGMRSRLAFSIACLVNPDILILDEVLSVGDSAFRKKSGDKMMSILKSGVTGILVSHSISQVRELCNKILWLDHGNQIAFTEEVDLYCSAYEEFQITKKLPKTHEDVELLAANYTERKKKENAEKAKDQLSSLEKMLSSDSTDELVKEAERIIRNHRPELLAQRPPETAESSAQSSAAAAGNS